MGIPIGIYGKSGYGKSTSFRNMPDDNTAIINVTGKQFPFRNKFSSVMISDDYQQITEALQSCKKDSIIIDDAGYLLVNMFMKGHSRCGAGNAIFSFYNKMADNFWSLIETCKALPENKLVYFIMHETRNDAGDIQPKTIGRLLDEKVCIEGMFTVFLRAIRDRNGYFFSTQTDGFDIAKSPFGMFESQLIPNDLTLVDKAVRDYYNLNANYTEKGE